MPAIRVLFVHGLEGHPNGSKVLALREQGFEVHAADMHMSLYRVTRRNSAIRHLLRLWEVRVAGVLGLIGAMASASMLSIAGVLATLVLAGLWWALRSKSLISQALARSFDACVAIQREAVVRVEPDIVVGSSWGGAVAAELIVQGCWDGPTILLAPAIQAIWERTGRGSVEPHSERLRALGERVPMIVFHDPTDETVPHADSVRLAADSEIEMRSVSAGGHRLLGLLERGELGQAITASVAASR